MSQTEFAIMYLVQTHSSSSDLSFFRTWYAKNPDLQTAISWREFHFDASINLPYYPHPFVDMDLSLIVHRRHRSDKQP
jgi:hypothetical protein